MHRLSANTAAVVAAAAAAVGFHIHVLRVQVPFRRVHLTNDTHFDLYDTSGPQVIVLFVYI
jgi:hypothetical protein